MKKQNLAGCLFALLSGTCYGMIPLILLSISRAGRVAGPVCSMYRIGFAGLLMLPWALFRLRKQPVSLRLLGKLTLVGFVSGTTALLLYEAFDRVPSGMAIAVHYTYPLQTLFIFSVLFRQKLNKAVLPAAVAVLAGVVLLCDLSVLPEKPWAGLAFALISGTTCSIYYTLIEKLELGHCDPVIFTSFMNLPGALIMLVYNCVSGTMTTAFSAGEWSALLLAGAVMVGAVLFLNLAVARVGSVTTTVLCTMEPIVCTIGSALLLGDAVTPRTLSGAALIIAAVILVTVRGTGAKAE